MSTSHTQTIRQFIPAGPIRTPVSARPPLPPADPASVWSAWVSLMRDLISQGHRKSSISARTGLSPTCGQRAKTHRYVLYPNYESWARLPPGTPRRHHCSSSAPPWTSARAAGLLIGAMRSLAAQDVADEYPGMARRATLALESLGVSIDAD